ncbi:hypothetical protein [Sulfoacidibacillus thermotolerans]|uniref:Uncharacterized protein n=1 Tax=Sulfoacidibacillus thermotolerans TaxID=1765684 RepID=A0A2U3D3H8_SULT2|nr:hypothetical protein [Sulfoacidibacillus thermotolerans]PWI55846.1 hypothetical protein BM613_13255 [Sulfoacidibacillus thermotolerans]
MPLSPKEMEELEKLIRQTSEAALAHKYRPVPRGEKPTMDFYIVDQDGKIMEAADPLFLGVAATGNWIDDCDFETTLIIGMEKMVNESLNLSLQGIYSKVYSAIGLLYDPNFKGAEWENPDDPILLDAFGMYTVLQGYVKSGRYRIFERIPYLTKKDRGEGCHGCKYHNGETGQCAIWRFCNTKNEQGVDEFDWLACQQRVGAEEAAYPDYVEVTVDNMSDPSFYREWMPFEERKEEHEDARKSWTDSEQ